MKKNSTTKKVTLLIVVFLTVSIAAYFALLKPAFESIKQKENMREQLADHVKNCERIDFRNGTIYIELKPDADIGLAIYQTVSCANGMPFKITQGKNIAESGAGYCVLDGEVIDTLEDLASRSLVLRRRLREEEIFNPEELAVWDRYFEIDMDGLHGQEAIDAISSETGMTDEETKNYMQFLFHREQGHQQPISAELFRDNILLPSISYHPGTAGYTLSRARAAASIVTFITDYQLRFVPEDQMNQTMNNALELLSDEDRESLIENLPALIELIDTAFSDYSEVSGLFNDAGADYTTRTALAVKKASEDWKRVKTPLEGAC